MIYAIPPAIRITALGIRGVPVNTVEAAASMGATRTADAPARCSSRCRGGCCLLGVNQTILFALSMVVIAGPDRRRRPRRTSCTSGLYSNPALAILAGIVIVVMAMALDRITEAIAERTDPAQPPPRRGSEAPARQTLVVIGGDRRRDRSSRRRSASAAPSRRGRETSRRAR